MKTRAIYLLYRTLQALALPLLLLYFLLRGLRDKRYLGSLQERLGGLPRSFRQTIPGAIWLHAVSVGEVISAVELLRQLHAELPRAPVFVSVSTLAGRATADEKLRGLAAGVFYAPVDYVFAVRRVLRALRPSVVAVLETEIWPNLFREVRRSGAGLLLVNGRISDRAAPRYFALAWFFRHVLAWPQLILAQSEELRARFLRAGAPAEGVVVGGNLKYDFQPREAAPDSPVRAFLERLRPRRIWIAASTMPPAVSGDPDEDDVVIEAFQRSRTAPFLVLAPRRPERFDVVAQKLERAGVRYLRRSALRDAHADALLLDSIGELSGLFFLADVVLMGGTLAHRGGHNILEPAFFARPVIVGPHMENFQAIADEFREARAVIEIQSAAELAEAVDRQPGDVGQRALVCARSKRGVTGRSVAEIRRLYETCLPRYRSPLYPLLWPLSLLWQGGGRLRRTRPRGLIARVISVGNITMGGTGKTPIVMHIAAGLKAAGRRPGILTRGYGRHSPLRHVVLEAGARAPVEQTGDEAQMFLRSGLAPVAIGSDRIETGRCLQEQADVLILDDGFQHRRLARDADIVLIDALNPFGGGEVFPLGRLREYMTALARADVFVITRSDAGRTLAAIEWQLRRYNARAPVFHSRVAPRCWIEYASGESKELPARRVGAFCGLGNPESFWQTLALLGLEVVDRLEFADHHSYRPRELRHISEQFRAVGAEAIVTTEKDSFNLCEDCEHLLAPLRLYWLKIDAVIEGEQEFLRLL